MKHLIIILMMSSSLSLLAKDSKKAKPYTYPVTNKIAHTDTYFGTAVEDPYQWLENDTSAETAAWVSAENKVTFDYLDKIPYRQQLKDRFKELYDFTKFDGVQSEDMPMIAGDYVFFYKKEGLQNQPVIYVQKGLTGNAVEFINPNKIDEKGLTSISLVSVSNDNNYVVASFHKSGSDWEDLKIYDIKSKQPLNDKLEWLKTTGASWYKDGFFYSGYEKPTDGSALSGKNEYHSVYYHKLGDVQEKDELVFRDKLDSLTFNIVSVSENDKYLFLYRYKGTYGYEVYWKKTSDAGWNFKPLFTGFESESAVIEEINDKFLVHTDKGSPNMRLVLVDPNNPDMKNWKDIIPEEKNATLEKICTNGGKLVAKYIQNANNKLFVFDIDGKNKKEVALPGLGTLEISGGKSTDKTMLYTYTSFTYPKSIFSYDFAAKYSTLFKKPDLKFNPDDFESKQVWYKSKDGTKVSMFIVYKKGLVLDGKNPTYLYAYGGFSINMLPTFSASRIMLLENGGVYAMPNLRGGSEYGEEWHKAGMLTKKQNVFDDFIYAAKYLVKQKYTSKDKLAIAGGSNGGLLIGAVMTQQPKLCKVAFPAVGVMDMLKYHKFTIGWGWVPEYGSSDQSKEMFEYLKGYSPYHNLKPNTKYPATMVTTADHDDRVVPAHSFKFAARLQEYNTSTNPMLIRIGVNAGHGAGKPTSKIVEEIADQWSFFFWNLGYKYLSK